MNDEIKRRELFKAVAGSLVATAALRAQQPHKFFTPEEFAVVEEFTDILIPSDAQSAGAKQAKVTEYLDGELAEAFEDDVRQEFRKGVALVEQLSKKLNGAGFVQSSPAQRRAVVLQMAENEAKPTSPEELFFRTIKSAAVRVYYTTKIGIHDDLTYKGNVYQPGDYAGELPSGPALADYHGTK